MFSRTRHVRVERVALKDHRDVALLRRQIGDVPAADEQAAARRGLQPGDHPQHRALAAAGRPDQDDELAVGDRQVEILHGHVTVGVHLGDGFEPDVGHG